MCMGERFFLEICIMDFFHLWLQFAAFSALMLLVGWQEGDLACKN